MQTIPLTLDSVREQSTATSFQRGESYYHEDAVISLFLRGQNLEAKVAGSEHSGHQVTVKLADNHITLIDRTGSCDCDAWCKQIVAVLLAYLNEPNSIEKRLTLV
jgi:uncharacterized Zn finger protein